MIWTRRGRVLTYLAMTAGVVIVLFPYYWLTVMASNTTSEIYASPPRLTGIPPEL